MIKHNEIIKKIFEDPLIPDKRLFRPEDLRFYSATRSGGEGKFHYENELNREFWDKNGREIICLIGEPGSGKTTILKYYLKCDCPYGNSTRSKEEIDSRREDFDRKLIININFEATTTEELF